MGIILMSACTQQQADVQLKHRIDSLNEAAYNLRYKNLGASTHAANEAYAGSGKYTDGRMQALNNMAFCAFMRMDFEQAARIYRKVEASSRNEIEILIAEVGMMKIAQRTSMNKDFYDYRNRAQRRIRLIDEDRGAISSTSMKKRLEYAISEFHIVSGIYYYYLQQYKRSIEAIYSVNESALENDTSQWLYYLYMKGSGGMYKAANADEITLGEFESLVRCYREAVRGNYLYFEGNALQGMAEMLIPGHQANLIAKLRPDLLRMMNPHQLSLEQLPLELALQALNYFKRYGDLYQISGTYRTLATYYNQVNQPDNALKCLRMSLDYVNLHHTKYYHSKDSLDRLFTYSPYSTESTELRWIHKEGIKTVPEWISRLREQLSQTYSALGRKTESDYNRNIYLDLLDYTRQDKELESRYSELEAESQTMNTLLTVVAVSMMIMVMVIFLISRRWRMHQQAYFEKLKTVLELARKITSSLTPSVTNLEEMVQIIEEQMMTDLQEMFSLKTLHIDINNEEDTMTIADSDGYNYRFPLVGSHERSLIGEFHISTSRKLKKEDIAILNQLLPYLSWCIENGFFFLSLDAKRRQLETDHYLHTRHLAENKRQNIEKKACMAIVLGIFPYLDRIVNEVGKLKRNANTYDIATRHNKYEYIHELTSKINEYNDILSVWIKMRRGELSLHIDNFDLNELFELIAKGKRSFEMKHQQLVVSEAPFFVKADRALTLFMLNTLIENAHKFTPDGGLIKVDATECTDYIEISVTDNGPGLSTEDIAKIIDEKVVDSGNIGMKDTTDKEGLRQRKGHGFGLMNCKGIIEKYKKTNPVFSVCTFNIQSRLGEGARFFFRLPKGVRRLVQILILGWWIMGAVGCNSTHPPKHNTNRASHNIRNPYDSLLAIANSYSNQVYNNNILGNYREALLAADTALIYLNRHYLHYSGSNGPLLQSTGNGAAHELTWWSKNFDTDYYIILDVRNEAAVAALALKDFQRYRYNNAAYTALYRQISKDNNLEQYCESMEQSSTNKQIGLALLVVMALSLATIYYFLYLRHRLRFQYNLEQVLRINNSAFAVSFSEGDGEQSFRRQLMDRIYSEFNELLPIDNMGLTLYDEFTHKYHSLFFNEDATTASPRRAVSESIEGEWNSLTHQDGWYYFPLRMDTGNKHLTVGVWSIRPTHPIHREDDRLLIEFTARYLAVVLHQRVINVRRLEHDIELATDESNRLNYEENQLHVQNMVLDNCLSTIKHETIYYPNRIRQIVEKLDDPDLTPEKEQLQLQTIDELVSYYKEIFTILSMCASRQLDEVTFKRTDIEVSTLIEYARQYLTKVMRRKNFELDLHTDVTEKVIIGDEVMMRMMLETLIDEAVSCERSGRIRLTAVENGDFVRFDFTDERRSFTSDELNQLFYPNLERMTKAGKTDLSGTAYLICKQIIREHDEYSGRRGCRINAEKLQDSDNGFTIWFTIPLRR